MLDEILSAGAWDDVQQMARARPQIRPAMLRCCAFCTFCGCARALIARCRARLAAQVRGLAMEGRLGPGVLAAAQKVLANAQANPATIPELLQARLRAHSALSPSLARAASDACAPALPPATPRQSLSAVTELLGATISAMQRLAPKAKLAESLTALDPNIPAERESMRELMALAFAYDGAVDRLDFIEDMVFFLQSADEQDAGLLAAVAEGRVDLGDMKLEEVMLVRRQGRDRMSAIVDLATGMA
jgi:hypothetical protein